MGKTTPTEELRRMQPDDLKRETDAKRITLAKMRIDVRMKKEKDTARYRREKRSLARMQTILTEMQSAALPK